MRWLPWLAVCCLGCTPHVGDGGVASAKPPSNATQGVTAGPMAASAPASAAPGAASPPGPAPATYASIEEVDWENWEYLPGILKLRDGHGEYREYSHELRGLHDTTTWKLITYAYGDFDGDGAREAIVLIGEEHSAPDGHGSARTRVYVYQLRRGQVTSLGDAFEVGEAESAAIDKEQIGLFVDGDCHVYRLTGATWIDRGERCPGN